MYPALADRRIPERIEPTPVVRDRLIPNGQDQAILTYKGTADESDLQET